MNAYCRLYGICCGIGICGSISFSIVRNLHIWDVPPYIMLGAILGSLLGVSASSLFRFIRSITTKNDFIYAYGFVLGISFSICGVFLMPGGTSQISNDIVGSLIGFAVSSSFIGGIYGILATQAVRIFRTVKSILLPR